ncbi:MAG: sigma-54 dependent transcriptional regulator [Desulfobacterales bacterium]|nr:sigma-54 dependent transcriptional regulator [Desulfobacterales bacterium]MDD4072067.1 sigma-54 dependent transcriptional regulator [Desulfobacterales bacterium]MDD4391336.1 sigma-54 dependent transcriptional regulator [Desulfobacterales bacterium]
MKKPVKSSILVATANVEEFVSIRNFFEATYHIDYAPDIDHCRMRFQQKSYEFMFIDISFLMNPDGSPADIGHYKQALILFWQNPGMHIVVLSPQEKIREAVYAVKAGADNYLTYPVNRDEIHFFTESIHEDKIKQSELDYLRDQFWEKESLDFIKTQSDIMKSVFSKVRSVTATRTTVLLHGETGTGKGVMARLIHRHSNRKDKQFITVHCGAIQDTLLESELFGHEKGAFTGAIKRKLGKFEIAHGGTIFLDEIGTISAAAQIKLLQVLQDRTYARVGGEEMLETDVRIIAATNTDLKEMCAAGSFRKDLFYRISVFPIEIPNLRDRIEDIPILVDIFLNRLNKFNSKEIHAVHPMVMEAFARYAWPGNIRELENLVERGYILETSSVLTPESFPLELFQNDAPLAHLQLDSSQALAEVRRRGIEHVERQYLKKLLTDTKGKINQSALAAGISTRQLHKLLTRYGIRKEDYK